MIVFNLFSELAYRAPGLLHEHAGVIKKSIFPSETLAWTATIRGAVYAAISLGVFPRFRAGADLAAAAGEFALPLVVVPFFLFLLGICWFLMALGSFTRDVAHLMISIVPVFMFATPIFYSIEDVPPNLRIYLHLNPIGNYVEMIRDLLLFNRFPGLFLWRDGCGLAPHFLFRVSFLHAIQGRVRRCHLILSSAAIASARRSSSICGATISSNRRSSGIGSSSTISIGCCGTSALRFAAASGSASSAATAPAKPRSVADHLRHHLADAWQCASQWAGGSDSALGAGFDHELTGRENALIGGAILGMRRATVEARLPAIAAFAGIGDFFYQPVKLYSSGMAARLAFAVCAHADADILIVDEALSVGDEAFGAKCDAFIKNFAEHGTILVVSHDLATLEAICDRVLWIEDGVVRAVGSANEVIPYREAIEKPVVFAKIA